MLKKTILKECWIWNRSVQEFIKEHVDGYTLNVPCGKSKIGDVRGDLDPKEDDIKKIDMNQLPFADNTFDTVIQDLPWKIDYYHRWKPFLECVRVCKPGGKVIYNAYWIPWSKYVQLEKVYVRQDGQFTNSSIISIFKKTQQKLKIN